MESAEPRIKVEQGLQTTFVTFNDEQILEENQINKLEKIMTPIVKENKDWKLVLLFTNVQFMSSSFLGLLVKIHKRVTELGGSMELLNPFNFSASFNRFSFPVANRAPRCSAITWASVIISRMTRRVEGSPHIRSKVAPVSTLKGWVTISRPVTTAVPATRRRLHRPGPKNSRKTTGRITSPALSARA